MHPTAKLANFDCTFHSDRKKSIRHSNKMLRQFNNIAREVVSIKFYGAYILFIYHLLWKTATFAHSPECIITFMNCYQWFFPKIHPSHRNLIIPIQKHSNFLPIKCSNCVSYSIWFDNNILIGFYCRRILREKSNIQQSL